MDCLKKYHCFLFAFAGENRIRINWSVPSGRLTFSSGTWQTCLFPGSFLKWKKLLQVDSGNIFILQYNIGTLCNGVETQVARKQPFTNMKVVVLDVQCGRNFRKSWDTTGKVVELRSKVKLILVVMWEHLYIPRCYGTMNWHFNM